MLIQSKQAMNTMLRSSAQAFALKAAPFGSRRRSTAATTAPVRPRGSWRLSRKYIFPILLFSAVSSLAINVRNARDDIKFIEDQHAAQLSVLRDLIRRMTAGESISQAQLLKEYERVGIIKREGEFQSKPSQHITWKEMLFGRKKEARDQDIEDRELANIEKGTMVEPCY